MSMDSVVKCGWIVSIWYMMLRALGIKTIEANKSSIPCGYMSTYRCDKVFDNKTCEYTHPVFIGVHERKMYSITDETFNVWAERIEEELILDDVLLFDTEEDDDIIFDGKHYKNRRMMLEAKYGDGPVWDDLPC